MEPVLGCGFSTQPVGQGTLRYLLPKLYLCGPVHRATRPLLVLPQQADRSAAFEEGEDQPEG